MSTIALDIEAIAAGEPGDTARTQALLEMWEGAGGETKYESPFAMAALSPALSRVVSVALVGIESGREVVVYDEPLCGTATHHYATPCQGEAGVLAEVNRQLAKGRRLVTFRGRGYDVPILYWHMVAQGIVPCPLLTGAFWESRYKQSTHIDLWEQFTSFGAAGSPGGTSLRAWCLLFGLPDPKAGGMKGSDVAALVETKDADKLVAYCLDDARAAAWLRKASRVKEATDERVAQ